ncbi:GNAT family N-acetyltransferase [Marinifilum sp. D714]|uniref:GNAT family N-acetyltransferase n=1 Tax=Marinifilum sp. D714 TaxID=2937523 RepID=UPI0027BCDD19|nr:GNAT family N-acetyltransferase [Marinifilum sp. D714]MDQ2180668.1 GNAT family N-acetyltransferase [Marinifilum sp. D714]
MIDTLMEVEQKVSVIVADLRHIDYATEICDMIERAAKIRGTGIAKRNPLYLVQKIQEGKAIIAFDDLKVIGFCYVETWEHGKYVANSGLIVDPEYRAVGLAKLIKAEAFKLSRKRYPQAKIFGLTTSLPVMKINSDLGYRPVTFSELTIDESFWKGCSSCVNYDILQRTDRKMCLCTGMLFDPNKNGTPNSNENK